MSTASVNDNVYPGPQVLEELWQQSVDQDTIATIDVVLSVYLLCCEQTLVLTLQ